MSKFFIPVAKSKAEEERDYLAVKKLVEEGVGASLSSRRIFRLVHQEGGKQILAEVGMEYPTNGEQVFAIYYEEELYVYYICTKYRGVEAGVPIFCGEDEVISCEYFET